MSDIQRPVVLIWSVCLVLTSHFPPCLQLKYKYIYVSKNHKYSSLKCSLLVDHETFAISLCCLPRHVCNCPVLLLCFISVKFPYLGIGTNASITLWLRHHAAHQARIECSAVQCRSEWGRTSCQVRCFGRIAPSTSWRAGWVGSRPSLKAKTLTRISGHSGNRTLSPCP